MSLQLIRRRWGARPIAAIEADGPARALEGAAAAGVSLCHAGLRGVDASHAFLPGADLRGADLDGADLAWSFLRKADFRAATMIGASLRGASARGADFRRAGLQDADLRHADLRRARFSGADLQGARLTGARLDGAWIDWRWSAFAVELLRREAVAPEGAGGLIARLAFDADDRPYNWLRVVLRSRDELDWAVGVLGRAIRPGDDAPDVLRRLAADAGVDFGGTPEAPPAPSASYYWTRRPSAAG